MTKRKPLPCTPANCGDNFPRCGKRSTYNTYKCRCDSCHAASAAASRKYYLANPEKFQERNRRYRTEKADVAREYQKQWQAENREKLAEYHRNWRAKNPERAAETMKRHRDKNREGIYENARQWALDNPERHRENVRRGQQRRRARKRATQVVPFTNEQWEQKKAYWGNRCYLQIPGICTGEPEHAEHVKPLCAGGAHMLANIRPACEPCNYRKGRNWPFEAAA